MLFGRVLELVRGIVAWALGYGVTFLLVVVGVVDHPGVTFRTVADAYLGAHVFPPLDTLGDPLYLVAVPILVIALAGYHAGRALQTGVGGRLRTSVQSFLGTERYRPWQAVASGVFLAVGYTIAAVVVAYLVEAPLVDAIGGGLLAGLVVGIPAAVVGSLR